MGDFARKADGRRVFTAEFKRETVQRILSGEKRLAELSRELNISPTVIRHWKRRFDSGAATAVRADEDVVPASALREAQARIKDLERVSMPRCDDAAPTPRGEPPTGTRVSLRGATPGFGARPPRRALGCPPLIAALPPRSRARKSSLPRNGHQP